VPLLGICFGAQLIASALGCVIERAPSPEIGWRTLECGENSLVDTGPWFQYHADRWIDAGPVRSFMHNDVGPQAFALGRILAVQFHPEVTAMTASRWLRTAPEEVRAAGEVIEEIEEQTGALIDDARRRCHRLVDVFFDAIVDHSL
jgi:GMP synthase-like glutamine amidotransferase